MEISLLTTEEQVLILHYAKTYFHASEQNLSLQEAEEFYNLNIKVLTNIFWDYHRIKAGILIKDIFGVEKILLFTHKID